MKKTGVLGRTMGWLLSILLIAGLAAGVVANYPLIMREAAVIYRDEVEEREEGAELAYMKSVYPLIYGMRTDWTLTQKAEAGTPVGVGEVMIPEIPEACLEGYDFAKEEYERWRAQALVNAEYWYKNEYYNSLKRYAVDFLIYKKDAPEQVYCSPGGDQIRQFSAEYRFFTEIHFDQYGQPRVVAGSETTGTQRIAEESYERWKEKAIFSTNADGVEYQHQAVLGMGNMVVLFGTREALTEFSETEGLVSDHTLAKARDAMLPNYVIILSVGFGMVLLLGLILPAIRPLGLKEGWKAHIPLEAVGFVLCLITYILIYGVPTIMLRSQIEIEYAGSMMYWIGIMNDIVADGRDDIVLQILNGVMWFALLFAVYLCVINIRQIFAKGLWRALKENTLIGWICCGIARIVKKITGVFDEIDFSLENNKGNGAILIGVLINGVVIAAMSLTWFGAVLLVIPYSIFLIWWMQRRWKRVRTDYEVLLSTTKEMAEGVTDVEYIPEAGVFHELKDALCDVQEGFHQAVQEEVKSQHMKTELITNVSHDLKTPLTAIITYVDLLKNEELATEERQGYVKVLEQKSARLKSLIEDLFEISKAASGNIKLDIVELDLVQLIKEVQMELEEEIMNSGIEFKVTLPEEKILTALDAQKTSRIFENLFMNVVKHGLTGSRAYIRMEETEKTVSVVIKNISCAEINYDSEAIMERFTRGDASRNTEGSGLGLAIVKSFTEAQGGSAKVELDGDLFKVTVAFPKLSK